MSLVLLLLSLSLFSLLSSYTFLSQWLVRVSYFFTKVPQTYFPSSWVSCPFAFESRLQTGFIRSFFSSVSLKPLTVFTYNFPVMNYYLWEPKVYDLTISCNSIYNVNCRYLKTRRNKKHHSEISLGLKFAIYFVQIVPCHTSQKSQRRRSQKYLIGARKY